MEARPVGLTNQVWNYPRHDFVGYPTAYPSWLGPKFWRIVDAVLIMKGPVHGRAVALDLGGTLLPPDYALYC